MLQRIGLAAPILRWGAENLNEVLNCFFCFHHSLEVNFRWVQTKKASANAETSFGLSSGGQDSNLRPRGPKPRILPG